MDTKAAALESLPSSSRVMRNLAEKQRRDKLNSFIGELATLVPVVASASRKLDKTSILRLSANYLRLHQNVDLRRNGTAQRSSLTAAKIGHTVLDALEGFLLVICSAGKVMYVSETVEKYLGHSQVDMMGLPFCYFVHPDDQLIVRRCLGASQSQASTSRCGQEETGERSSFECRLAGRPLARGEPINYERVQITGHFRMPPGPGQRSETSTDLQKTKNGSSTELTQGNGKEWTFVAVVRLIQQTPVSTSLTILDSMRDQFITRHLPDGRIIHTDHRISIIAGYFTEEVQGKSAYSYIYTEDLHWSLLGFKLMANNPTGEGLTVYRLISRTGQLIYLRSRGFVEIDSSTQQMVGFVCINSLLSEEEGELEIHRIRELLTNITTEQSAGTSLNAEAISYPSWTTTDTGTSNSIAALPTTPLTTSISGSYPSTRTYHSSVAHNSSPLPSTPSPTSPSLSPPVHARLSATLAATSSATAAAAAQMWRYRTTKDSVYVNRASMSGGHTSTTAPPVEYILPASPHKTVDSCTSPISINGGFFASTSSDSLISSLSPKSEDSSSSGYLDPITLDPFQGIVPSMIDYRPVLSPRCSPSTLYTGRSGCGPIRYRKSRNSKDLLTNSPTASTGNA